MTWGQAASSSARDWCPPVYSTHLAPMAAATSASWLGVADHHAVGRVDAGAAQIIGAKLYLAYAVNVRKAEQLGKKALQIRADTCSIR